MKVYVVDDEQLICESIGVLLKRIDPNAKVREFLNAQAVIAEMEHDHPDIIISDIRMPDMDGLTLLRLINERWSDVEVIFLTGYPQFEYAQQAIRYGASDYLLKPTRFQELESAVKRAIAKHRNTAESTAPEQDITEAVRQAKMYIRAHYAEDLTLKRMGEVYSVHPAYFSEQFARVNGKTFVEYLTEVRIRQARILLAERKSMPITEVAMNVGYTDSGYFSTVFKKVNGISPSEYRRSLFHD